MKPRRLGSSVLEVYPLALGGNVFGWTVDEQGSFEILDAFVSRGFNLIDTADIYSRFAPGNHGGESETIIGNWLRKSGKRNQVLIATKAGMEMGPGKKGLSRSYIMKAAEDSLRRLQTDHIDLYQSHTDDPDTPPEETLDAYAQLVKQGKVLVTGASNFSAERLSQSLQAGRRHGYPVYQSLQTQYNLCERADFEQSYAALCQKEGLGVLTYFSLAGGFLTGKYRSEKDLADKARGNFVKKYLTPRGLRIVDALDEVAHVHNAHPASVALAWLMGRPGITAPIASATSLKQLKELFKAVELELAPSSVELLNEASASAAELTGSR